MPNQCGVQNYCNICHLIAYDSLIAVVTHILLKVKFHLIANKLNIEVSMGCNPRDLTLTRYT